LLGGGRSLEVDTKSNVDESIVLALRNMKLAPNSSDIENFTTYYRSKSFRRGGRPLHYALFVLVSHF